MKGGFKLKKIFAIITAIIILNPLTVFAKYRSNSDTGVEILDYIENRRREERDKMLTEEQKKLLEDIEVKKDQLPHPGEGNKDNEKIAPAIFEGDNLIYHADTGEFIATGKVDIIQIDGHRFQSNEAYGNVKDQVVRIPSKAHVMQVKEGAPRVTLDGYRTFYNYGTNSGTMGAARGKAGEYYISGKRFEFYPDHIVAYDAYQTKCGAKRPDYKVSAEKMEIWPDQVIKMYNIKFWIKDNIVGTKDYDERAMNETTENNFPRVGYNKDHGAYVEQKFEYPFTDHFRGVLNAHVETKKGVRSSGELRYTNRDFNTRLVYGFYDDSDNIWIQKEPSLLVGYGRPIKGLPLSYGLGYEIGHWRSNSVESTHQKYEVGLTHNPIFLGKYMLLLHTSYTVTKESADDSTVNGINYDAVIGREFDKRFAAFAGYHYTKNTTENSLFDYDNDDYARKFETGFSYVLDPKNRFVVGVEFDTDKGSVADVDYYWYHDLHCSQIILRYREKRDKIEAHWQFTPW